MCHIWSQELALCFWRQSSCCPAGHRFDHCVSEVRFVEFGPGCRPSCAQVLKQTAVSQNRVIKSLCEVLYQACGTNFTTGISTQKHSQTLHFQNQESKMRHYEGKVVRKNLSLFHCKYFLPAIVWQFVGELNTDWLLVRLQKRTGCLNGEKIELFGLTTSICA